MSKKIVDVAPLMEYYRNRLLEEGDNQALEDALERLRALRNADVQDLQLKAKWERPDGLTFVIQDDYDNSHTEQAIKCSNCGGMIPENDFDKWVWNFCPVCGAKMEEAE